MAAADLYSEAVFLGDIARKEADSAFMHIEPKYANVCLWPKADIETESKSLNFTSAFGRKSGHSALLPDLFRGDIT